MVEGMGPVPEKLEVSPLQLNTFCHESWTGCNAADQPVKAITLADTIRRMTMNSKGVG